MHNIAEIERKICPIATLAAQKNPMHRQKVTLNPNFIGKPVNTYDLTYWKEKKPVYNLHRVAYFGYRRHGREHKRNTESLLAKVFRGKLKSDLSLNPSRC